jgi:hypothetical protein
MNTTPTDYDERGVAKDLSMRVRNFLVNAKFKNMEARDLLIETMEWLEAHGENNQ